MQHSCKTAHQHSKHQANSKYISSRVFLDIFLGFWRLVWDSEMKYKDIIIGNEMRET
jgi:hypothetical protein